MLYFFSRAAIRNCHRLGDFKQEKIYSHISGDQRPQIKGLVPSGGSEGETALWLSCLASDGCQGSLAFLGLKMHHSYLCLHLHIAFSVSPCVFFPSYKDISFLIRTLNSG